MHRSRLVAACMLTVALAANADYEESFKEAMEAFNSRNWESVARHLRDAISDKPTATGQMILLYGGSERPYLPYYYLGRALYESEDLEGAREALEESRSQGAVAQSSSRQSDLERILAEIEPLLVAGKAQAHDPGSRLQAAAVPVEDKEDDALGGIETPTTETGPVASPGRSPEADGVAPILGRRETAVSPPGSLRDAANSFFSGDYANVIQILEGVELDGRKALVQAALFRAAAYFRQHTLAEEEREELLERSRIEVEKCRSLERDFRPDSYYFSPGFLDFFASVDTE